MVQSKCGFNDVPGGASGRDQLALHGPTLTVVITFNPQYDARRENPPPTGGFQAIALVDTGASESCIDNLVASQINLPIIDRRPISGAHGAQLANIHLAQIWIPSLNTWIYGTFAGVALSAGGQVDRALIGRAFLQHFTMIYEGRTGTVILHND